MIPDITNNEQHYLIGNIPLYFYADDYKLSIDKQYLSLDQIHMEQTDNGYIFTVQCESLRAVTMVFPTQDNRIIMGDSYDDIDTRVTRKFYYHGPTSILDSSHCINIYAPIVHLIGITGNAISCSVFGECLISCCKECYEQYVEITGIPHNDIISFHVEKSQNYKINLQRYNIPKRDMQYCDILDLQNINDALYYGMTINQVNYDIESHIQYIKKIQDIFRKEHLDTIITGSFARQLNGIHCPVNDCDLMTKNRQSYVYAKEILQSHEFKQQSNGKFIDKSKNKLPIDISYDNYNITLNYPKHIKESHGLRFFDIEGLMWLSLLNCYEFHLTSYESYYQKNDQALFELTRHAHKTSNVCNSKVVQQIQRIETIMPQVKYLCDIIKDIPVVLDDIRINNPFRVNKFKKNSQLYFSIINLGDRDNARLIMPDNIKSALWIDVNEEKRSCQIKKYDKFNMIFIDKIKWPGIVICEI